MSNNSNGSFPTIIEKDGILILENKFVKYVFDLDEVRFSGTDKGTNTLMFDDATMRIDAIQAISWSKPELEYLWKQESILDDFGKGIKLFIYVKPLTGYQPISIFTFSLYQDQPFSIFGWGVQNTQPFTIRVCEAEVLYGGALFADQEYTDAQVLRGGAGAEPNFVEDTWEINALNSAMLTYKEGKNRHTIVAGGLRYCEFMRQVEFCGGLKSWKNESEITRDYPLYQQMTLTCWDPQGKRIEPNSVNFSPDTTYIDFSTENPFTSLEQYGKAMRIANNASPNYYDFPTLCGWMISTKHLGEGKPINNSPGLVEQVKTAQEHGFMKYSKLAVRLEPDYYCNDDNGDTQQGWWDDEHWAKYGSLQPPYETFDKWCAAVKENDGVPFTYFQTSLPSNDFALAHPDWMLNNDISRLHLFHPANRPFVRYDYTDPGFRAHLDKVWGRLRKAGLQGVKFDYPETGWHRNGGFEDPSFTTTSAYCEIFAACRRGLGPDAFIHERNLGGKKPDSAPRLDATAGIVDLQRVWGDASHFEPEMASRMGLRWYKNRVVFQYYPDGKSLYMNRSKEPLPAHKRRTFLTTIALLSGRLELGTSIGRMTEEMLHDVTRVFPMIKEPKSPRPVDMFLHKKHPEVYVYDVNEDWYQVFFINNDLENAKTIIAPLSGDQVELGSLGLSLDKSYHAFDFWNQQYLGVLKGDQKLSMKLQPEACAVISVRSVKEHPQILSTNRHIMQGMFELSDIHWDAENEILKGKADVIGDEDFVISIALNGYSAKDVSVEAQKGSDKVRGKLDADGEIVNLTLESSKNVKISWEICFVKN